MAGEAAAAGVTVTAASPVLQHPRTTVTGPRGTYWLGALPPGQYDVTFSKAGMTTLTRRAVVELGRVARADGRLEPSADEESVTSTATQTSVADTTAVTSHFDDETLDRFPGRDYAVTIAPDPYSGMIGDVDGISPSFSAASSAEDAIEQVTVVRAAAGVEHESYGGRLYAVRTRSGREQFFLSVRDTVSSGDGVQNLFEAHGGGRIVPQRLWFFGAFWTGSDATRFMPRERGVTVRLDGQAGAAHHFDALYTGGERVYSASLRHTGVFGPRITTETFVSRATVDLLFPPQPGGPAPPRRHGSALSSRASFVLPGEHVLTAGFSAHDAEALDSRAFFAGDRWSPSRWVVNAGVRWNDGPFKEGRLAPRIAATYDLRGDGTRAIAASYGHYEFSSLSPYSARIAAIGYAAAIASSGIARVDVLRRSAFGRDTHSLQLDARYRLFDRFEAGATYTYTRGDGEELVPSTPPHDANAWIGAQLPVGAHEFGVTLLQQYVEVRGYNPGTGVEPSRHSLTDVALRYAIPLSRAGLTFAVDAANVFNSGPSPFRTVRFWTRVRL